MTGFSERERTLMDEAARSIVARRLAVPAMMLLETVSPMNLVTASMLHIVSPVWRAGIPAARIDELARLLERRDAIPEFIRVIDAAETARASREGSREN
ncbi:MAG TPA: hypothetical protein VK824_06025 [Planctomycetota bacterium]|nr:hypothetical protein [Planctomycetota bacterium]